MWVELQTGKDSFRAQQSSPRRNVAVQAFTRVENDGEGRQILPLWQAFTKRLKGFGKQNLMGRIAATEHFAHNDAGQWFKTRFEVAPRTEILLEYRHRGTSGFAESIEYLLLVADPKAPLWQIRIDLPDHYLSAVPAVFFEGRFEIVDDDALLPTKAIEAWRKPFGFDKGYPLCFYTDACQPAEDKYFRLIELEARVKATSTVEVKEDADGKKHTRIRRVRNIKVR